MRDRLKFSAKLEPNTGAADTLPIPKGKAVFHGGAAVDLNRSPGSVQTFVVEIESIIRVTIGQTIDKLIAFPDPQLGAEAIGVFPIRIRVLITVTPANLIERRPFGSFRFHRCLDQDPGITIMMRFTVHDPVVIAADYKTRRPAVLKHEPLHIPEISADDHNRQIVRRSPEKDRFPPCFRLQRDPLLLGSTALSGNHKRLPQFVNSLQQAYFRAGFGGKHGMLKCHRIFPASRCTFLSGRRNIDYSFGSYRWQRLRMKQLFGERIDRKMHPDHTVRCLGSFSGRLLKRNIFDMQPYTARKRDTRKEILRILL